jgi:glycosyltransferase involved in cell wall biosynthesis
MKTLLFVFNDSFGIFSHRIDIVKAAINSGYTVHIASGGDISKLNSILPSRQIHQISITRSGLNIFIEFYAIIQLFILVRRLRPTIIHLVTLKSVLYGSIVSYFFNIKVVSAFAGLGLLFSENKSFLKKKVDNFILILLRFFLNTRNQHLIFQNKNDYNLIVNDLRIDKASSSLIPGSGVDLSLFKHVPEPQSYFRVVMVSRLLKNKGVKEFIYSARMVRLKYPDVQFQLVGSPDLQNPNSVTNDDLDKWNFDGTVFIDGFREDISFVYSNCNVAVLPSYYGEGLPKSLIEASACGRPIITTDLPGCRDAVIPNKTGLLIKPADKKSLYIAIITLLENQSLRVEFGVNARNYAEIKFDVRDVVEKHLNIYKELSC